jgi:hypothetical protein
LINWAYEIGPHLTHSMFSIELIISILFDVWQRHLLFAAPSQGGARQRGRIALLMGVRSRDNSATHHGLRAYALHHPLADTNLPPKIVQAAELSPAAPL